MFYNKTNKKEYNLQILQYNIYYTNIILMKNINILKKTKEQKELSMGILNIIVLVKEA